MSELNDLWKTKELTTKFWYNEKEATATANRMSKTKKIYITTLVLRTPFCTLYALTNKYDPNINSLNGEHYEKSNQSNQRTASSTNS